MALLQESESEVVGECTEKIDLTLEAEQEQVLLCCVSRCRGMDFSAMKGQEVS
jgi:hypothetical protein